MNLPIATDTVTICTFIKHVQSKINVFCFGSIFFHYHQKYIGHFFAWSYFSFWPFLTAFASVVIITYIIWNLFGCFHLTCSFAIDINV